MIPRWRWDSAYIFKALKAEKEGISLKLLKHQKINWHGIYLLTSKLKSKENYFQQNMAILTVTDASMLKIVLNFQNMK